MTPNRQIGLQSIQKSREERAKKIRPPLRAGLWFGAAVVVATAVWWFRSSASLETDKQKLLAEQRTLEAALGAKWYPVREVVESATMSLAAAGDTSDLVAEDIVASKFREKPGIYLRLRRDEARTVDGIRAAAKRSQKDAFTTCLITVGGKNPLDGKACERSSDCESGQLCNEYDHCGSPSQPFNLRQAYKGLDVLSPSWVESVQETSNDMRIRALRMSFDDAMRYDVPLAIDLLTQAKFFLLVMDDRPAPPAPPAPVEGVKPPPAEDVDVVDGATYPSTVAVYRIEDRKLMLRMKREVGGELMGGMPVKDVEIEAARKRQAQSCQLALETRRLIGDEALLPAPAPKVAPPEVPSATPSASPTASPSVSPTAAPSVQP